MQGIIFGILTLGVMPYGVGLLFCKKEQVIETYVMGMAAMMAVFFFLCEYWIWKQLPFGDLCKLFLLILGVLCLVSYGRFFYQGFRNEEKKSEEKLSLFGWKKAEISIYGVICLLLIVYQIGRVFFLEPVIYGDDTTYISMVNDIVESDLLYGIDTITGYPLESLQYVSSKYLLTSFFPFLAFFCKCMNLHALIFCKTLYPVFFMPMAYGIAWEWVKTFLSGSHKKKEAAMLIFLLLVEFWNVTEYGYTHRLLMYIWQGKAYCFVIAIPYLCYLLWTYMEGEKLFPWKEITKMILVSIASLSATLMGSSLVVILSFFVGLIAVVQKKDLRRILVPVMVMVPGILMTLVYYLLKTGVISITVGV